MTINVTLVSGMATNVPAVDSVDIAGGVLALYGANGLLAGFASGQWKFFTITHA